MQNPICFQEYLVLIISCVNFGKNKFRFWKHRKLTQKSTSAVPVMCPLINIAHQHKIQHTRDELFSLITGRNTKGASPTHLTECCSIKITKRSIERYASSKPRGPRWDICARSFVSHGRIIVPISSPFRNLCLASRILIHHVSRSTLKKGGHSETRKW